MPAWKRTIDLKPAVELFKTSGDIPATAAKAVEIIEASGWLAQSRIPSSLRNDLTRLKQARTVSQYTMAFEYIYDAADLDRVWIETS